MSLIIGTGITVGTGIAVGNMPLHPVPEYFVSAPGGQFEWFLNTQRFRFNQNDGGVLINKLLAGVNSGDIVVGSTMWIDWYETSTTPTPTFVNLGQIVSIETAQLPYLFNIYTNYNYPPLPQNVFLYAYTGFRFTN